MVAVVTVLIRGGNHCGEFGYFYYTHGVTVKISSVIFTIFITYFFTFLFIKHNNLMNEN